MKSIIAEIVLDIAPKKIGEFVLDIARKEGLNL